MKHWIVALLIALCLCASCELAAAAGFSSGAAKQERRLSLSRYMQQVGDAAEALARAPVETADRVKDSDSLTQTSAIVQSTWRSLADLLTIVAGSGEAETVSTTAGNDEQENITLLSARRKRSFGSISASTSGASQRGATTLANDSDEGEAESETYTMLHINGAYLYTDVTCNAPSLYAIPSNATLFCVIGYFTYYLPASFVCGLDTSLISVECLFTSALGVECVCPTDQFPLYYADGSKEDVYCYPRLLDVKVQLPHTPMCYFEGNAALGLPTTQVGEYCLTAKRNDTIELQVLLAYDFGSTAEHKNYMDSSFHMKEYTGNGASQEYYALSMSSDEDTGQCTEAANLTYLRQHRFPYHEMKGTSGDFAISSSYDMSSQVTLFATVFHFTRPEKMSQHKQTFNAATYMLSANGTGTFTVHYDLSSIAESFIEGGRLYIEIGARSNRLLDRIRVARLHIDLEDWEPPAPSFNYEKDHSMLYFCIMIVTLVSVVGIAFAVFWLCFKGDDGDEDTLIQQVDRSKEKKTS